MTSDEKAILDVIDKWMIATKAGDLNGILKLVSDDVVFQVPGAEPFGKAKFVEMFESMKGIRIDGVSKVIELKVLQDWAFIRNLIELTITPAGKPPERRAGYTLTLLRKNGMGEWQLARDANLVGPVK